MNAINVIAPYKHLGMWGAEMRVKKLVPRFLFR